MAEIFFPIGEHQNANRAFSPGGILTMNQYDILIEMIRDLQNRLNNNTESLRSEILKNIKEQEKTQRDLCLNIQEISSQINHIDERQKKTTEEIEDLSRRLNSVISEQESWKLQLNGAIKLSSWIAGTIGILWLIWEKFSSLLEWIKTK